LFYESQELEYAVVTNPSNLTNRLFN
jgi:hypothetical protein